MRIVIAAAAKQSLIDIGERIRPNNPARAITFVQELLDHCYELGEMPLRYPLVPRYAHWGVRRRVHGRYSIFYRMQQDAVEVVHILYGAIDYESLLFPDGYLATAVSSEQAKQQESLREAFGQIPVDLDLEVTRQGRGLRFE